MNTRGGQLELRVPQARGYRDENGRPLYPKALDRGVRSERAMILAMAEMEMRPLSSGSPPRSSPKSATTGKLNVPT
jgi:hypothetical protein